VRDKRRADRVVVDIIDANGVYCSRGASAGGYVFLAGTALNAEGVLAAAATVPLPYRRSESAKARLQAAEIFARHRSVLSGLGSSLDQVFALETYLSRKVHADGYFQAALAPGFLERSRPVSATVQIPGFSLPDLVAANTGIALVSDGDARFAKTFPKGDESATGRLFSEVVSAGEYVLTTYFPGYFPSDSGSGVVSEVKVDPLHWTGSEIRNEARFAVETLKRRLATVGGSIEDLVSYSLFLTDISDLYELDLVFRDAFGDPAPSRAVIPVLGFAVPRREGAMGHEQDAPRMEVQFRCVRRDVPIVRTVVPGPADGFGYQSAGMRVGALLWLSGQYAGSETWGDVDREFDDIAAKLSTTCAKGGTSLSQTMLLRVLVTKPDHAAAVYRGVRRAFPTDPPPVSILVVPSPLLVEGATVAVDGVTYVPHGSDS
jgi:enamine deaminase RidA (YjgF/YER057c/UK114 family)